MRRIRFRDDEPSVGSLVASLTVGALAGFAVGVLAAQKLGGLAGITQRLRSRVQQAGDLLAGEEEFADDELESDEDEEGSEYEADAAGAALEEAVLAAFRDDAVLNERAIDIGSIGDGIIELAGRVDSEEELEHAVTVARGVGGIVTVVNRLEVGDEEELLEDNVRRYEAGDDALNEAHWEGNRIGTGQRRQGRSDEIDRHATPKPELEERWMREDDALRNAAEEPATAERRRGSKQARGRGGRAAGSPNLSTQVPKADHVRDPEPAPDSAEDSQPRAD